MEHAPVREINFEKIGVEILERYTRDQDMRVRDLAGEDAWDNSVDTENTVAMKHIIAVIGWPSISKVGSEAAFASWRKVWLSSNLSKLVCSSLTLSAAIRSSFVTLILLITANWWDTSN